MRIEKLQAFVNTSYAFPLDVCVFAFGCLHNYAFTAKNMYVYLHFATQAKTDILTYRYGELIFGTPYACLHLHGIRSSCLSIFFTKEATSSVVGSGCSLTPVKHKQFASILHLKTAERMISPSHAVCIG